MTTAIKYWLITLATLIATSTAQHCFAYNAGDFIARAGFARVQPNDDSDPLSLNGTELSQLGNGLPRTEVQVDGDSQLGITFTYMINSHWGLGLLASTPFKHDVHASALGVKVGEAKHLPPTLTLQYFPMNKDAKWQPYVGLGINYTQFFDEKVDGELDAALAGLGATGDASLSLDSSWGLAAQLGVDYKINDRWVVNSSLWYINIETTADVDVPGLGKMQTDIDINPWGYMLSVGYVF